MPLKVSIIIVNWNGKIVLQECLDSIEKYPPTFQYEIIVVDNNSSDGSVEYLKEKKEVLKDTLKLILNDENLGFGIANNQAMRASDAEYFFLLNSDAEVKENAIENLIRAADKDDEIGVVGPRVLNPDGSLQPSIWRNPPTPWEILVTGLRLHKLIPRRLRGQILLGGFWNHDQERRVKMVGGAALVLRRKVFESIGGFNEQMHMYGEDCELCLRIHRAGWILLFTPDAEVIHKSGQSSYTRWSRIEKMKVQMRGFLFFQEISLTKSHVIANCVASIIILSLGKIKGRIRNAPSDENVASLGVYTEYLGKFLRKR